MDEKNRKRLMLALEDWLVCQGIQDDVKIFEGAHSAPVGFHWPEGALVVWMYDSGTHNLIHMNCDYFDLQDLLESFGFRPEFSYDYHMAIFVDPNYDFGSASDSAEYSDVLKDERWVKKAARIKTRALHRCEDCGVSAPLQAHHCYYARKREGLKPWEYPMSAFRALCRKCHEKREHVEMSFRAWTAKLTHQEIEGLQKAIDKIMKNFGCDQLIEMLLKSSPKDIRELYKKSTEKLL